MTDERKKELGKRVEQIGHELQMIAKEYCEACGLKYVSVHVTGTYDEEIGCLHSESSLHENTNSEDNRFVSVHGYIGDEENKISDMFLYDRDDTVRE